MKPLLMITLLLAASMSVGCQKAKMTKRGNTNPVVQPQGPAAQPPVVQPAVTPPPAPTGTTPPPSIPPRIQTQQPAPVIPSRSGGEVAAPAPEHDEVQIGQGRSGQVLSQCSGPKCAPVPKCRLIKCQQPRPVVVVKPCPGKCPQIVVQQPAPAPVELPSATSHPVASPNVQGRPLPTLAEPTPRIDERQCTLEQRLAPITNKLDVLFVMDTSQSLDEERQRIADQIDKFIVSLSRYGNEVDYRIAVLLAHGPGSEVLVFDKSQILAGASKQDFRRQTGRTNVDPYRSFLQADEGDPKVLISQESTQEDLQNNPLGMSVEAIRTSLKAKFAEINAADDSEGYARDRNNTYKEKSSTAQGEAGLLALYLTTLDEQNYQQLKSSNGNFSHLSSDWYKLFGYDSNNSFRTSMSYHQNARFFREDAALAVIFVADENDVCYDYKSPKALQNQFKPRWKNAQAGVQDPMEVKAFNSICRVGSNGSALNYEQVLRSLKRMKGEMPLIISGIMYTDNNKLPNRTGKESKGASKEENEAGRGYLELIAAADGEVHELNSNYAEKLAKIGDLAAFKMQYQNAIPLVDVSGQPVDRVQDIDPNSIRIDIYTDRSQRQLVKSILASDRSAIRLDIDSSTSPAKGYAIIRRDLIADIVRPGQVVVVNYQYK